jgi:hypothetical protein
MVQVIEVPGEGLVGLIGQVVTFWCASYIWTGTLVGVNEQDVKLEHASLVFDTGTFTAKTWQDAQKLPHAIYLMKASIEAYTPWGK